MFFFFYSAKIISFLSFSFLLRYTLQSLFPFYYCSFTIHSYQHHHQHHCTTTTYCFSTILCSFFFVFIIYLLFSISIFIVIVVEIVVIGKNIIVVREMQQHQQQQQQHPQQVTIDQFHKRKQKTVAPTIYYIQLKHIHIQINHEDSGK